MVLSLAEKNFLRAGRLKVPIDADVGRDFQGK
jgi:hypothetical protein